MIVEVHLQRIRQGGSRAAQSAYWLAYAWGKRISNLVKTQSEPEAHSVSYMVTGGPFSENKVVVA